MCETTLTTFFYENIFFLNFKGFQIIFNTFEVVLSEAGYHVGFTMVLFKSLFK